VTRRRAGVLALAVVLGGVGRDDAWAHAGLRFSNPSAGATLGDSPKLVQLTFREKPEARLSEIRVIDTAGTAHQFGGPESVAGAPFALAVRVRPLERGVYTVSWRTLSSVDGHVTAGAFAFGVRIKPTGVVGGLPPAYPAPSAFETTARFLLIVGLVALLGAAAATVARFGGASDLPLGAAGWLLAVAGLVLLAVAQWRHAAASFAIVLDTAVGRALLGRAVAIVAAGLALLTARSAQAQSRRRAMAVAALASLAAMAVHAAAGHAGASGGLKAAAAITAQWAHFAAAGIWLGGLAALLLGVRGTPSADKAAAVGRFSRIAATALLVVVVSGVFRTVNELSSWRDLVSTGYGRVVAAKIALIAFIAALGALNRWRGVPAATTSLRLLRRVGSGELALAAGALFAAAVLGTLPPPASGFIAPTGLDVAGADFGTTVRVRLSTASDEPGPNRFVAHILDYDSKTPVRAKRVSLRFTPLDDPGVAATSLPLEPGRGDSWEGSGANLAFDGRWRVAMMIERERDSVEVALDLETRAPPQFVSVERIPGQAPNHTVEVGNEGYVRFSPDPERPGRSALAVTCFDVVGDERQIVQIVVTAAAGSGAVRRLPVRRVRQGGFLADIELQPGRNRITAVARAADGARLRAVVEIDVPAH
jgi:copper transport protein